MEVKDHGWRSGCGKGLDSLNDMRLMVGKAWEGNVAVRRGGALVGKGRDNSRARQ